MKTTSYNYLSISRNFFYDIPCFFPCKSLISEIALPLINLCPQAAKTVDIASNFLRYVTGISSYAQPSSNLEKAIKKTLSINSIVYCCFNQESFLSKRVFLISLGLSFHPVSSKWSSVIRVVHEIFLSYCNFLEKKARLTYDLGGMDIITRNTAIQIRSSSLQNSRQNFFCESIEKIAHLSFLLFPSQNTKEIALATSALNAIRIIFQKWNSQKPLQTAGHCLIAAIKSYSVYSLFPKQSVSPNNYCPKEKHYFLEALAEEDPVKNLKEPDSLVPFEAEWQNDENASIPNNLKKNFIQYSEVELLELKILFGEVPFHQNEFS